SVPTCIGGRRNIECDLRRGFWTRPRIGKKQTIGENVEISHGAIGGEGGGMPGDLGDQFEGSLSPPRDANLRCARRNSLLMYVARNHTKGKNERDYQKKCLFSRHICIPPSPVTHHFQRPTELEHEHFSDL